MKKILIWAAALLALLVAVIFGCYGFVEWRGKAYITAEEGLSGRDAIVVFGARVYPDQTLSPMLRDRLLKAVQLYKNGVSDEILLTGDSVSKGYDEISAMTDFLISEGIPKMAIKGDAAGVDTYDSVYRIKHIYGYKAPVFVTQSYHLTRALFLAETLGQPAVGVPCADTAYSGWQMRLFREHLSRVKAVGDSLIKPKVSLTPTGN